jgi:hypothetical protein
VRIFYVGIFFKVKFLFAIDNAPNPSPTVVGCTFYSILNHRNKGKIVTSSSLVECSRWDSSGYWTISSGVEHLFKKYPSCEFSVCDHLVLSLCTRQYLGEASWNE